MIFQHTHELVMSGKKTQTRRLVKPGEVLFFLEGLSRYEVYDGEKRRTKWQVGKTYAVQPGRGQKGIGRILITGIRREDVRKINLDDVKAEGFYSKYEFLQTWLMIHKRHDWQRFDILLERATSSTAKGVLDDLYDYIMLGDSKHYDAWVLEFEVIE